MNMKVFLRNVSLVFQKKEQRYEEYTDRRINDYFGQEQSLTMGEWQNLPGTIIPDLPAGTIVTINISEKNGYVPASGDVVYGIYSKRRGEETVTPTGHTFKLGSGDFTFVLDEYSHGLQFYTASKSDKNYMIISRILTVKVPVD